MRTKSELRTLLLCVEKGRPAAAATAALRVSALLGRQDGAEQRREAVGELLRQPVALHALLSHLTE